MFPFYHNSIIFYGLIFFIPIKIDTPKNQEKRITITAYRAEYERNNERIKSKKGKYYKKKRSSTVESVFGVLTQYLAMRKVNTQGLAQANKVMQLAAVAYNLKKYLKFTHKKVQNKVMTG